MDKISLSKNFHDLLIGLAPKNKIIDQLMSCMDLNKFKEFLGLVKKCIQQTDEDLAKTGLSRAEVEKTTEELIKEMVNGNSSEIKCIVHNFVKASAFKDPLFLQRVKPL